jgi:hypothetical protein
VSASPQPDRDRSEPPDGEREQDESAGGTEEVDALPVLADAPHVLRAYPLAGELSSRNGNSAVAMIPAVQAAAVAAGGFVAGAAVAGLMHRHQRRSAALTKGRRAGRAIGRGRRRATPTAGELVQIVGSRSLLVDVHLLGGRD